MPRNSSSRNRRWRKPVNSPGRLVGPAFQTASYFFDFTVPVWATGQLKRRKELRDDLETALGGYLEDGALRATEWFEDNLYYVPSMAEVMKVLNNWTLPLPGALEDVFDCDDFAYFTRAQFALHRRLDPRRNSPTPFSCGIAWGESLSESPGRHALNIVYTDQGVVLVDKTPDGKLTSTLPMPRPAGSAVRIFHVVI